MKEKGIIMSGNHPKLILDGIKTMTRRVIKDPRKGSYVMRMSGKLSMGDMERELELTKDIKPNYPCPYGLVGDRLWVRETFVLENDMEYGYSEQELAQWAKDRPIKTEDGGYEWGTYHLIPHYRATEPEPHIISGSQDSYDDKTRWTPSIYMPRWASRITLEITEVRVERLQDITEEDMKAEGIQEPCSPFLMRCEFAELWDSLNAKRGYGWEVNPWVWVISFATGVRLK